MVSISSIISDKVRQGALALFGQEATSVAVQLQKTRKEFEGDITLVVFPFVRFSKKSPEATAQALGEFLADEVKLITSFNVVKGFLNLSIADDYWIDFLEHVLAHDHFGFVPSNTQPRVLVEFSSPNTNKPLHLGHLRNIFLGDSVSRILKAAGRAVTRVQIINDRGIHICKSMLAWQKWGGGETPESSGMKGDKLVGKYYVLFDQELKRQSAALIESGVDKEKAAAQTAIMQEAQDMLRRWEARDVEVMQLWRTMNGWVYEGFNATYHALGVQFDKLYYESDTYLLGREEVLKGLERGIFYRKEDGSIWVDLSEEGLDQKALLRSDGTAMYITQDIGTAILRFRDYPDADRQIYTVGNEQEYHFKVLFTILRKLGWANAARNYHLSYGMVELPEGKMKSREGTVVDADDIVAEMEREAREVAAEQGKLEGLSESAKERLHHIIGLAALKYFLLRVDPVKNMLFNPRESIDFNGHTGPFIQYAYVRTRALLRKAGGLNWHAVAGIGAAGLHAEEKDVLKRLHDFPQVLAEAAVTYNPALLANYAYELARDFNSFYHEHRILNEPDAQRASLRLALAQAAGQVLHNAMGLLGIEMPEQM